MLARCFVTRSPWILSLLVLCPMAAATETPPQLPLITTTGRGMIYAVPDQIDVSFGISTCDTTLSEAKRVNDERTQKVLAVAVKLGIEDKDVQTSHMTISPRYRQYEICAPDELKGYAVTKTIVIRLHDVAKLEDLVSAGLKAGANEINRITFSSSEKRKHEDQARLLAVRAAREKAVAMAAALSMTVGQPHEITEQPVQQHWWRSDPSSNSIGYAESPSIGGTTATFALGQIQFEAHITVAFQLLPQKATEQTQSVSAPQENTPSSQLSQTANPADGNRSEAGLVQAPQAAGVGCIE